MEFRQIEAFVNVAKYKSFSKAADATFLTQPTISAHINNLENELSIQLLNRTGREITLTNQGAAFYPHAINMLNTRSQALFSVQNQTENVEGILDIHTSSIPGQYYLPKLMRLFREKYKNVCFCVEQSDSKQVINNILAQKGEIGLTGFKINNSLIYEPLFADEMVLIVPKSEKYADLNNGDTINFSQVSQEPFILREEGSGTRREMEQALPIFKQVNVVARMNSMEAIKQAVADGLGVSVMSKKAMESFLPYPIKYFCIEGLEKKRNFYIVHNKTICLSPAAAAFRNVVINYTKSN